jgi:Spy/CpxP family protein refolding chaperone
MKNLNNNQVRVLATVAVLTIILASAGLATAQGSRHGKGMGQGMGQGGFQGDGDFGPGHRIEMMAKQLDLSEEQLTTIKKIHEDSRKDGLEKRKELMRLRNELQGEMLKDSPSEKTVLGINSQMGTLKTEMKALRLKTRLAVREELTPEQRDQMLMMRGQGGKGGRMGNRGHGGFGGCDGPRGGFGQGGGQGKGTGARNYHDCRFNQ